MTAVEEVDDLLLDGSTKPLLVGELNPYGTNPRRALAPLPPNAAGGCLCRILGMTLMEYMRTFDRVNLCVGEWDEDKAHERARGLVRSPRAAFVFLGAKVCRVFGVAYESFTASGSVGAGGLFIVLPHPSRRCRVWNDPVSADRARDVVRGVLSLRSRS